MTNPDPKTGPTDPVALSGELRDLGHAWMEEARRKSAEDDADIEAWKERQQERTRRESAEQGFFSSLGDIDGDGGGG